MSEGCNYSTKSITADHDHHEPGGVQPKHSEKKDDDDDDDNDDGGDEYEQEHEDEDDTVIVASFIQISIQMSVSNKRKLQQEVI